jgi:diguanylate cyclase (GGDEF)-like protein
MKILVAEDDPLYGEILRENLSSWGYQVDQVNNGRAALEQLRQSDAPQIAILDWIMPKLDGIEVCKELRKETQATYRYILLLSGKTDKRDLVQGLEAGADDYLIKPFHPAELRARLFTGRRILQLQDQLITAREKMREQATKDFLTGVWNLRTIMERLDQELERSHRLDQPFSLLLVDIDHFKRVNDTFGHLVGDGVLRETARRMRQAVRPYDLVGRCGGEEFVILLPECAADDAVACAERVRELVAAEPIVEGEHEIAVTLSIGVASGGFAEANVMLQDADAAMYRAKARGRNRVELGRRSFTPTNGLARLTV